MNTCSCLMLGHTHIHATHSHARTHALTPLLSVIPCSNLLKQYLRTIPGSIVTPQHYSSLIEAGITEDESARVKHIAFIVQYELPKNNFATLNVLMAHLRNVAAMSDFNKMEVRLHLGPVVISLGYCYIICVRNALMT